MRTERAARICCVGTLTHGSGFLSLPWSWFQHVPKPRTKALLKGGGFTEQPFASSPAGTFPKIKKVFLMALSFWSARGSQVKGEKMHCCGKCRFLPAQVLCLGLWWLGMGKTKAQKNFQGLTQLSLRKLWADKVL